MPDARTGKTVDHVDAELLRRAGGVFHLLGRPGVHARRIAVAPNRRRQDRLVPLVDPIQHRLAHQVGADGEDAQVVPLQQFALHAAIVGLGQGLADVEMVAPAGQFEAVVAELAALAGQFFQGQIGPLAGT